MEKIYELPTIYDYDEHFGVETLHPLVNVVDLSRFQPRPNSLKRLGFYCVFLKDLHCGNLQYGRTQYDYQEGTLVFVAPNQVIGVNDAKTTHKAKGYALLFHPDLLYGTSLARRMKDYTFFAYSSNEALHMSERERQIVINCLMEIKEELEHGIDRHTKHIVASNIETLLNHCERFYDRQFVTREVTNRDVVNKLEGVLTHYFESDKPAKLGLPTVKYCAEQVFLSSNYFGDLIRKETGKTAQEYIKLATLGRAKDLLAEGELSVAEVSYRLGFKYPHHLNRLFKREVGITPGEYRKTAV